MIVQIIGWLCIGFAVIQFMALFYRDREVNRDIVRSLALFLIAAAICFK